MEGPGDGGVGVLLEGLLLSVSAHSYSGGTGLIMRLFASDSVADTLMLGV